MKNKFLNKFIASVLVLVMLSVYIPAFDVKANEITYSSQNFNLELKETSNIGGKINYDLNWDEISFLYKGNSNVPATKYYIARRKVNENNVNDTSGEYKWELRGNYTSEEVKVLNIYPDRGDGLQKWMDTITGLSEVEGFDINIKVDKQSMTSFNNNPELYLKKRADGSYNYDVVVFGFWDSNNNEKDITKNVINGSISSYQHMDNFIKSGYGVLFGHDTVRMSTPARSPYLTELLQSNSGFYVVPRDPSGWHYSEKIAVKQQGSLTTFPFDIYGKSLIIPMTHNVNQLTNDPSNIYMTFEKNYYPSAGDGPYYNYNLNGAKDGVMYDTVTKKYVSNFDVADTKRYLTANAYLMKENNISFIQAGHTSGSTSVTEQMIIANTIYSLKQMISTNKAVDQMIDNEKPKAPSVGHGNINELLFDAQDNGSRYKYRIVATPVGVSVYEEWDNIAKLLDNESVYDYVYPNQSSKMVAFSKVVDTGEVVSGIKNTSTFEYYIDTKPTGSKRDGAFISKGKSFTLPSFNTLTKDTYLHIWSYDNANNVSFERTKEDGTYTTDKGVKYTIYNGVTSINLWDAYSKVNATVKYENLSGAPVYDSKGKSEYTSSVMYGSTFTSVPPSITGYRYVESKPANGKIVVGADKNILTHVYGKLLSKKIKVVIHDNVTNIVDYTTVNGIALDEYVIDLPENYSSYKYDGYYTLGNSAVNNTVAYTLGDTLTIDNDQTLFLHYSPKVSTFDVVVKDVKNNIEYSRITKTADVGETLVITSKEIRDSIKSLDEKSVKAYKNYKILEQSISVDVVENTKDILIELIPRTKTVYYQGQDYGDGITTRSSVELIGKREYRFNGINFTEIIDFTCGGAINTNEWKFLSSTAVEKDGDYVIDYKNNVDSVSMFYYKGILPTHIYNIKTSYKNVVDNSFMPTTPLITQNPLTVTSSTDIPKLVPVEEYIDVTDYNGVPDGTSFEIDYVELQGYNKDTNEYSKLYKYDPSENVYEHLPELDDNNELVYNEYFATIYYKPYGTVVFNEYVENTNDSVDIDHINETEYNGLYGSTFKLSPTKLSYPSEITKVVIDGVEQPNTNFDFNVLVDDYTKTVEVYYRPLTYDLKVIGRSYDIDNYVVYEYSDIPVNKTTNFIVPAFKKYTFDSATANSTTSNVTVTNNKINFNPNEIEGEYVVYLDYKYNAEVNLNYVLFRFDEENGLISESLTEIFTEGVYLGEDFTFETIQSDDYRLVLSYMNGETYYLEEGKEYTFNVKEPFTEAYLVYSDSTRHPVTLKVSPENSGEVSGNTTQIGDNEFFENSLVNINAEPNDGYEFVNWTTTDVVLEDRNNYSTSFTMPNRPVTITANFKLIEETDEIIDGNDKESETGGGGKVTIVKPVTPDTITEPPLVLPQRPINPWDSENIIGLLENPIGKIIRKYNPYIQGYPEGIVRPNGEITRAEVMQIIYNLYGFGLYRDFYGDKTSINSFDDVGYNEWYSDAIAFCVDYGVVKGYEDRTIRPNQPITRAELAEIVSKFILIDEDYETTLTDIEDTWAKDAINKLYANGIINGYPDGSFKPAQTTIRSEFTVMVNRLVERESEYYKNHSFPDLTEEHWAYDDIMNAANGAIVKEEEDKIILEQLENNK